MDDHKQGADAVAIREAVAADYGKAVSRRGEGGGCGTLASCSPAAEAIGYTNEDMRQLPEGADVPTFGCGNPLAFSGVAEGDTVLDLGSGAGLDLLVAAGKVGPSGRVIGVDMTDEMIERARQNVAAAGHANVEVRKGLIEELPVESGAVDWVISNCVINLSPEKHRVFAEIARVLKPGGQMLVSDIVVESLPQSVRDSVAAITACVGGAVSQQDYVRGLREAGLLDVEVRARHDYSAEEILVLLPPPDEMPAAEALREALTGTACCAGEGASNGDAHADPGIGLASIKVYARKPNAAA